MTKTRSLCPRTRTRTRTWASRPRTRTWAGINTHAYRRPLVQASLYHQQLTQQYCLLPMRARCGRMNSPLVLNTRSIGAEVAGKQKTRGRHEFELDRGTMASKPFVTQSLQDDGAWYFAWYYVSLLSPRKFSRTWTSEDEDKDKDLKIGPRGQGLSSRITTLLLLGTSVRAVYLGLMQTATEAIYRVVQNSGTTLWFCDNLGKCVFANMAMTTVTFRQARCYLDSRRASIPPLLCCFDEWETCTRRPVNNLPRRRCYYHYII